MTRVLLIVALLAVVFWVFSVVDCAAQPAIRHRGVNKPVWILIVILLPVVGGLLWFAVGRVRGVEISIPDAPDDDPAFLGSLQLSAQDERIRQLEEELAKLDAEEDLPPMPADDTPRTGQPRTEKPRTEKPRNESPRAEKPRRNADGTSTPSPSTGENPPRRDGDADGLGRHGAIG